jgi:hypothetical protein
VKREDDPERLEEQAERMEQHSEAVGEHIEEARRDWEQKESAKDVPGAQPEPEESPDDEDERPPEE